MGLFGGLFGSKDEKEKKEPKNIAWIPLAAIHQLDEIANKSKERTQVIFKHSTSCGISRMVLNTFVAGYNFDKDQIDLYFLDLLNNREVSNETGYKFQVMHQSPQVLVIKDGVVVAHESHGAINGLDLNQYI